MKNNREIVLEILYSKFTILIISFILIITIIVITKNKESLNLVSTQRIYALFQGNDTSSNARIFSGWSKPESILIGNGLGNTQPIWNNLAYVYSDFGIILLFLYLALAFSNIKPTAVFLIFVSILFQKGGIFIKF